MNNEDITKSVKPTLKENKESNKILKSNKKEIQQEIKNDLTEHGTTISNLMFLQANPEIMLEKKIPKDTTSISTETDSNSTKMKTKKLSFSDKTKQWAGNVWNSIKKINIKNMFPKTEYQEYRNVNGDMVRIPKKRFL